MRKDKIFSIINEINTELALSNIRQQILDMALDILARIMKIDACWISLLDSRNRELVLTASLGLTDELKKELQTAKIRHGLQGQIVAGDKVVIPDLSHDDRFGSSILTKVGFASLVVVPLRTYHVQGILGVLSHIQKRFDRDTISLLMVIGNLICAALDKADHPVKHDSQYSESGRESEFDIKEFEKLVTMAEQYSEATRMAIKEATFKTRGPDNDYPQIVETTEDRTGLTSTEKNPMCKEWVEASTSFTKSGSAPDQAEITSITSVEGPNGAPNRIVSLMDNSFELHARQMMCFKACHTILRV